MENLCELSKLIYCAHGNQESITYDATCSFSVVLTFNTILSWKKQERREKKCSLSPTSPMGKHLRDSYTWTNPLLTSLMQDDYKHWSKTAYTHKHTQNGWKKGGFVVNEKLVRKHSEDSFLDHIFRSVRLRTETNPSSQPGIQNISGRKKWATFLYLFIYNYI